jgi:glycosyltransferase involved in cell wall biosynthesis
MFSVVIPYYNKSKYILRCIDSVWNQSYKNFEIIIVNDGSTDNGLLPISTKYKDKIKVIDQKNLGVSAARNAGITASHFPYIAFLDADDAWHFQYLEKANNILTTESNIKIIGAKYSRTKKFLRYGIHNISYFKFENYFKSALENTYFTSSSTIILKDFFDLNNGFNIALKSGEDLDVWFRAVNSGGNAFYINQKMVFYSDEDENQITKTKVPLQKSLVGTINTDYQNLLIYSTNKNFKKFVSIYVYFNLYNYFYDKEYSGESQKILKQNQFCFFGLDLIYKMPFWLGSTIINSKNLSHYLRLYLKFIIRYFYS